MKVLYTSSILSAWISAAAALTIDIDCESSYMTATAKDDAGNTLAGAMVEIGNCLNFGSLPTPLTDGACDGAVSVGALDSMPGYAIFYGAFTAEYNGETATEYLSCAYKTSMNVATVVPPKFTPEPTEHGVLMWATFDRDGLFTIPGGDAFEGLILADYYYLHLEADLAEGSSVSFPEVFAATYNGQDIVFGDTIAAELLNNTNTKFLYKVPTVLDVTSVGGPITLHHVDLEAQYKKKRSLLQTSETVDAAVGVPQRYVPPPPGPVPVPDPDDDDDDDDDNMYFVIGGIVVVIAFVALVALLTRKRSEEEASPKNDNTAPAKSGGQDASTVQIASLKGNKTAPVQSVNQDASRAQIESLKENKTAPVRSVDKDTSMVQIELVV